MSSRPPDAPFRGWPDIQFPGWLSALGFEDWSWRNDLCARAVRLLERQELGFPQLECWVSEDAPQDRELPEVQPKFFAAAFLTRANEEGPDEVVYSGESAEEAELAISRWLSERKDDALR